MENFIPLNPEYLSRDWLAMVINHYREIKQLSPIRWIEFLRIHNLCQTLTKVLRGYHCSRVITDFRLLFVQLLIPHYCQFQLLHINGK